MSLANATLSHLAAETEAAAAAPDVSSVPLLNYGLVTTIVVGLALLFVIVVTALGNLLVAIALFRYRSLRTISNYLIGNLALSDFLLATTILPLSTVNECLGHWVFGRTTCNVWLICDVLYCTASIWNLCVIAFDRFTATLYPMWYRDKRSTKQAALYVTLVWVIASAISVPPLLGWNDLSQNYVVSSTVIGTTTTTTSSNTSTTSSSTSTSTTATNSSSSSSAGPGDNNESDVIVIVYYCTIFQTPSYVLYSASGSFFLPFFVTFALYVKIFSVLRQRTARNRSIRHLKRRALQNNSSLILLTPTDHHEKTPLCRTLSTPLTPRDLGNHFILRQFSQEETSETSHTNDSSSADAVSMTSFSIFSRARKGAESGRGLRGAMRTNCHPVTVSRRRILSTLHESRAGVVVEASVADRKVFVSLDPMDVHSQVLEEEEDDDGEGSFKAIHQSPHPPPSPLPPFPLPPPPLPSRIDRRSSIIASFRSLGSLRSIRDNWSQRQQQHQQQQHFDQMEMRATMRMAVIIGSFCGMWLGFFTTYILNGWCDVCHLPRELDAFFFWLGYLNSTFNPVLYTIFNDDFRRAFKKILGCTEPSRLNRRTFARKV